MPINRLQSRDPPLPGPVKVPTRTLEKLRINCEIAPRMVLPIRLQAWLCGIPRSDQGGRKDRGPAKKNPGVPGFFAGCQTVATEN